ncbi:hypothetical protein [Desulfospira joergensenii]|uniref:hypothetical protein n=1 Tax=Desulfospira joergensenii TaxID=53329 RepID=UPI0003B63A02|nr:hypothetical protein [Desulfospira joergensenii]
MRSFMGISLFGFILLSLVLTGCISGLPVSENQARVHMESAREKEKALQFEEAIKEYGFIVRTYPKTGHYKTAVLKMALLHLDPDNPKADFIKGEYWLEQYLSLDLLPEEKEMAVFCIALAGQIRSVQEEKENLLSRTRSQKIQIESLARQLENTGSKLEQAESELEQARAKIKSQKSLEKELSVLKDKLEKIKAIDVQMHKAKKKLEK